MFRSALEVIAEQTGTVFVAEGEPFKQSLSDKEIEGLPVGNVSLKAAVDKIANAYDYETEYKGKLCLLRKRYTNPADLPSVTIEEARESAKDVLRIVSSFSPKLRIPCWDDPKIQGLMASFTEEQWQAMSNRQSGLPVGALNLRQRSLVWCLATHYYLDYPQADIEFVLTELNRVMDEEAKIGWKQEGVQPFFGYEAPDGSETRRRFRPLNGPNEKVYGNNSGSIRLGSALLRNAEGTLKKDPTAPPPEGSPTIQAAEQDRMTLGSVAETLSSRLRDKIIVDHALSTKPVIVIGDKNAPPLSILSALAEVYGLRVKEEKNGSLRITRRLWRAATSLTALSASIRHVFPEPLLRAMHVETPNQSRLTGASSEKSVEAEVKPYQQSKASPDTLRDAAIRRLRSTVEPKLKRTTEGRLPLKALDNTERMALANALMADCLSRMRRVLNPNPPSYLSQFGRVVLAGGLRVDSKGKRKFALVFCTSGSEGKISRNGPGFGDVEFIY